MTDENGTRTDSRVTPNKADETGNKKKRSLGIGMRKYQYIIHY